MIFYFYCGYEVNSLDEQKYEQSLETQSMKIS